MYIQSRKEALGLSIVLGLIALMVLVDILMDLSAGGSLSHVALEVSLIGLALFGLMKIWTMRLRLLRTHLKVSDDRLKRLELDAEQWKRKVAEVKSGLSTAIDEQFRIWQLTKAEQEIARLILKGLTNKEIASIRESSEQTIKQQTNAIYRKSGLASRSQLSAFFLEDLF